ncbi:MAG TPA: VanZ family protein [Lacibacter sp.]|nr:VanZ family protein [Lacibacter sp.]HMO88068.1 VanZ family protein [Lacibacter sp.]
MMQKRFNTLLQSPWPALLWSALVFLLLAMPSAGIPEERIIKIPQFDKLVHAALFFVLVYLWGSFLWIKKPTLQRSTVYVIALLASLYGFAMEYVQLYTGRDFEWGDMVADAAGALVAAGWLSQKK